MVVCVYVRAGGLQTCRVADTGTTEGCPCVLREDSYKWLTPPACQDKKREHGESWVEMKRLAGATQKIPGNKSHLYGTPHRSPPH